MPTVNLTGAAATTTAAVISGGVTHFSPLTVSIDQSYSGFNFKDNRTVFYDLSNVTLGSGGFTNSQWYLDSGPIGMATDELESRAFCLLGQASFSFTGVKLIVRLNVAFSWFTGATVTIDGVAPSTLALFAHSDTLSCDAASYGLISDSYVDVVVADGLSNTAHAVDITINSTNPAQFFSIVGYKVGFAASQPIERDGAWLVPTSDLLTQNVATISVTNNSSTTVVNPTLSFPAGLVTSSNTTLSTLTAGSLAPGAALSQAVTPVYVGSELSGQFPFSLPLSGEYYDPAGQTTATFTETATVGSPSYVVTGLWFTDFAAPGGLERIYTTTFSTAYIQLTFVGDSLSVTVESTTGWGFLGLYASDNSTLLFTIPCDTTGGTLITTSYSGFGAGTHTVFFKKISNDGLFVVLVSTSWSVTSTFTTIDETVTLNYEAQQPYAMPVQDLQVTGLNVTFDAPIPDTSDLTDTPVRENTYLAYTEVLTRFPTYAVCYLPGYFDILAQYDRLIVDPLAVHAADVIAWQAMGIKVYGYISSGEEVGTYSNRYDFTTSLAPYPGSGPGGYAEYYMFTQNPVSGPPDQDGVWSSYYINPDPAYGWPARVESYYIPQCVGGPVTISNETVTTKTVTTTAGSVIVFDTALSPIDIDQPITLTTLGATHTYVEYQDFTFDQKTGAFVLSTTISPAVTSGDQLLISYTRKGHNLDGIFWDTVDTPDVYGGFLPPFPAVTGYAALYATMFNTWKADNPSVPFISNRGFTILPNIIQSVVGVMFESWLTLPTDPLNLTDTGYAVIGDPAVIAQNNVYNALLSTLRQSNVFDVYSLNYVQSGPAGAALQLYCREQDAEHGYLSWQSTITLTSPAPNSTIKTAGVPPPNSPIGTPLFPITTNAFTRVSTTPVGGM